MASWMQSDPRQLCGGVVVFRGTLQPRAEEFYDLERHGLRVTAAEDAPGFLWQLTLEHPQWGTATMSCPPKAPPPPREAMAYDPYLTRQESQQAAQAASGVLVLMEPKQGNVLRDRKLAMRFLRAVMGADGVMAYDPNACRFWSPTALDDELSHEADLDIAALFAVHAVIREGEQRASWLHTHGLGRLGGFDFDILQPDERLQWVDNDILRALAFNIVEGKVQMDTERFMLADPVGVLRFVPASRFARKNRRLNDAIRELHDAEDEANRSVICDPVGGPWGRWFGRPRPSSFLTGPLPDDFLLQFTDEATDLMAERARKTYGIFRRLATEFAEFEFAATVKLRFCRPDWDPDSGEHLWFEVHEAYEDAVDATLANEPFGNLGMHQGDRGRHAIEQLTDWVIFTPAGPINPRTMRAARTCREHADELRKALAESKKNPQ